MLVPEIALLPCQSEAQGSNYLVQTLLFYTT